MNEAGLYDAEGNSYIGADTAQIDRYIEGSFVEAWRRCASVMPKAWLQNLSFTGASRVDRNDGTGYIVLPKDFYLLNIFQMPGWNKAVYDAYIENERTSSIQTNVYTKGSTIRPVVTISSEVMSDTNPNNGTITDDGWETGDVRQVLNYYSVPKWEGSSPNSALIPTEAVYIPVAKPIIKELDSKDLGLDHRIVEPMAYLSAASVFTIFEKYKTAQGLEQRVIEMFPAFKSVKGTNVTFKQ